MRKNAIKLYYFDDIARIRKTQNMSDVLCGKRYENGLYFYGAAGGAVCAQLAVRAAEDVALSFGDFCFGGIADGGKNGGKKCGLVAKNVRVYTEKYVRIDRNWHKNGYPAGEYPDALLPVENAERYGENICRAGENFVFFTEIATSGNLRSGEYTGAANLIVKQLKSGKTQEISVPVRVKIYGAHVGKEITAQSLFTVNTHHLAHYEGEKTQKLYERYADFLLAHRVCQSGLYLAEKQSPNEAYPFEKWAEICAKFVKKGLNTLPLPEGGAREEYGDTFSEQGLVLHILALYKKSLEKGVNLLKYAVFYDWRIDEPFCCAYPNGKVLSHIEKFKETIVQAEELAAASGYGENDNADADKAEFLRELIDSMKNIPHIITDYYVRPNDKRGERPYNAKGEEFSYDPREVTLCPTYNAYETEGGRALYARQKAQWWYGCNQPNAPYLSYHTDDCGFSPELAGMLAARYGVKGNLYWAVNFAQECNTTGKMLYVADPYDNAHSGTGANGDGCIVYPGRRYGVKGAVASLRLKSVRSGNEYYELIARLKSAYTKRGFNAEAVLERIFSPLADGTKIDSYSPHFPLAREALLTICELYENYNAYVTCEELENKIAVCVFSDIPCEISGGKYRENERFFLKKHAKSENISVITPDKKRHEFSLYLGEKLKIITHEQLFARGAYRGDFEEIVINRDEIRRSVIVRPRGETPEITIDTGENFEKYKSGALMIRVKNYKIQCEISGENGKNAQKTELAYGWNRVNFHTNGKKNGVLKLRLNKNVKCYFGEIYLL